MTRSSPPTADMLVTGSGDYPIKLWDAASAGGSDAASTAIPARSMRSLCRGRQALAQRFARRYGATVGFRRRQRDSRHGRSADRSKLLGRFRPDGGILTGGKDRAIRLWPANGRRGAGATARREALRGAALTRAERQVLQKLRQVLGFAVTGAVAARRARCCATASARQRARSSGPLHAHCRRRSPFPVRA